MRSQKEKIQEINEIRKAREISEKSKVILPTDVILNMHKETPLQDHFVRMKTTSVHHQKFADSIDILLNLLNAEQENLEKRMV